MYGKSVLLCRVARLNVRYYKHSSTKRLLEFLADMPKANTTRIAESQRQRQQIAKKSEKYGPSCVYLQVLGSGARGAPNTLYMFTDQKRYLFNCGEQTQRLAHEHKVKLSRLDHIFITSRTWKNIGGLPGLSLTLQDVGVPSITLHGPERLDELYAATKRFVIMKDMKVTMAKCSPNEDFEDNVMSVKYVVLSPDDEAILVKDLKPAAKKPRISEPIDKSYEEFMHDNTDYYKRTETGDNSAKKLSRDRHVKSPISPTKKRTDKVLNDLQKMNHCTVSYICTLKKRLGTLDLAKCVERGVKPGPLLGQLKNGQDVVLPDGTLVLSSDVKTPDDPGPVFIVLDVPDITYLKEQDFSAHFADGVNPQENIPTLIVHYTPPNVFHDPAYQKFISLFGPAPRHLILNGQNSCLGSEAVHRTQHKLHLLDPDIFPLLKDVSVPAVWNAPPPLLKTASPIRLKGFEELKNKIALAQFQNIINMEGTKEHRPRTENSQEDDIELIAARALTMFHLRPKKQLDRSVEPKLHIQDYIQETMDVDGFVGSLEQFRRLVESIRYCKGVSSAEYPKVVFLGTGSCIPSKTRNTSAIVVHVDENRSMLLDCGEGTFGQLVRFYGPKRVNAFLRTLRAIYISHLHADHHIGLIGVLQARRQAFDEISTIDHPEPVHLLAPGQIMSWLSVYDQQFERIRTEFTLLPNQSLLMDLSETSTELTSAVLAKLGVSSVKTCQVPHCPNAFGVALQIGQHKITYSGDTLPADSLVRLGQDSSLLIHEATMEDELAEEARMKMHSTTTQAIDIGRKMNARYTVLTHFSQRYARLPRLNANILNDNTSVGIAFDNMQITMNDLELLPHMYAPLQLMFAEHCVEMELKAAHRARQKQRQLARRLADSEGKEIDDKRRQGQKCKGSSSTLNTSQNVVYRDSLSSKLRIEGAVSRRSPSAGGRACDKSRSPSRAASGKPSKTGTSGQSTPCGGKQPDAPAPLRGTETTNTPRTLSLTSNACKNGSGSGTDGHIVDSRSKTLNTVPAPPPAPALTRPQNAEANHIKNNLHSIRTEHNRIPDTFTSAPFGYGKPLVTPTNKPLTLRRDFPQLTKAVIMKNATRSQDKSPSRSLSSKENTSRSKDKSPSKSLPLKVDNRQTNSKAFGGYKTPAMRAPSPKLRVPSVGDVQAKCKSPVRNPVTVRGLKGSASSQNRQYNNHQRDRFSTFKNSDSSANPRERDVSESRASARSPLRHKNNKGNKGDELGSENVSRSRLHGTSKQKNTKDSSDYDSGSPTRPCTPKYNSKHETSKLAENAEKRFNVTAAYHTKRAPLFEKMRTMSYNSGVHNKAFKPQLEDIKSSFLLLNKIHQNRKDIKSKMSADVSRPKALNEEERRQKLMEAKQSFQTKRFWHESKYDKIEGLNWISWK